MVHPKTSNDPTIAELDSQGVKPKKSSKKIPPEPLPLPSYQPLTILEHTARVHLPSLELIEPLTLFRYFFTEDIIQSISANTNAYAEETIPTEQTPGARCWRPTTPQEIWAYIGVTIYMGVHPQHDIESYWITDESQPQHPLVKNGIARKRWEQIERYFHVSSPTRNRQEPWKKVYRYIDIYSCFSSVIR